MVSDKGVNIAIEAIAQLIASSSKGHLRLTIIGDGSEKDNLLQLTHRLGITENVAFKGILQGDKLVAELNKNRYMLVPSVWEEPFGNVALEGIACGCLPIVSDGGGLPEAVGDAGLRFPSGDSTALANAIENLLMHPELEQRYRAHFSKHLEQHHPDNIAQKYLQVLESVYGK